MKKQKSSQGKKESEKIDSLVKKKFEKFTLMLVDMKQYKAKRST